MKKLIVVAVISFLLGVGATLFIQDYMVTRTAARMGAEANSFIRQSLDAQRQTRPQPITTPAPQVKVE